MRRHLVLRLALAAAAALLATAAVAIAGGKSESAAQSLIGTFTIKPGTCANGKARGTYFRMIFPGGSVASGRFFANPDSSCPDKTYTLATPGRDGGLATGRYQPTPSPAFDSRGSSLARSIIGPASFSAIRFGVATNRRDAASGQSLPAPSIRVVNGKLRGQVQAFTAQWNRLTFNQGSPKPDGSRPATTLPVTGRYDSRTRAYVLEWTSAIVGGPFNGFTGFWHFEGT
ncbi:MAG: hypothetical protein QOK40_1349, partial [Miltoncostaeaceae bacterium]|nr:hypothetical protein [Miltoncostaeaceae bacterium]